MRSQTMAATSKTDVNMQRMEDREVRRWRAVPVALTLALGAGLGAPGGAAAADPAFDFVPEGTSIRALDTAGNDVTQAGGRVDRLKVRFEFPTTGSAQGRPPTMMPVGSIRDLSVALPEGLQGNPQAAARCPAETLWDPSKCPKDSMVGRLTFRYRGTSSVNTDDTYRIYNAEPPAGVVARFILPFDGGIKMPMDMRVNSDGSYRIESNIRGIGQQLQLIWVETEIWGVPATQNGSGASQVPMLTMGTECGAASSATMRATSWAEPSRWIESTTLLPALTGCDRLQFHPTMDVRPTSNVADAPSGYRFQLKSPQNQAVNALGTPPLKRAEVLFPEGTAISPGGANGLGSCSDAQAKIGVDATPSCPSDARIGSVTIDTPVLDVPMKGGLFVGTPKSNDAQSGDMFRVFLLASAKGVDIKQEGKLYPDPVTGRLKAVFDNAAKQPFDTLTVEMNGGPGAALVNPPTCGTKTTTATLESWGGQSVTSESSFDIACAPGLGAFAPNFLAGVRSSQAGAQSPFALSVGNLGGGAPLDGMRLRLPKGLLANLKGNIGQRVGSVTAFAGTGAAPFQLPGTVTLEGAYGDAPFSLKVVVPAIAGPYNLGEVVVKQKLYVDPNDAHVTVVSDPIPTILQGVPTRIQRLDVNVDKPGFMVNPTTCEAQSIGGTLSSSTGQTAPVNTRFQVGGCGDLDYAPKLALGVAGELKNGGHPQLDAKLTTTKGHANQRTAQVTLPLNLALDPKNAKALCEPADAAKSSCPAESIVGSASAVSILDVPLEGPVYFVRGERTTATGRVVGTLPKLFVPLSGQGVTINVRASSDVVDRKLQTTFEHLPDAPIESFSLQLNGGANGILKVTNGDVCKSSSTPKVGQRFVGQNGRVARSSSTLSTGCKFGVVKTARKGNRISVTAGGLAKGKLTVSGRGISSSSRSVGAGTTVASVGVSLNAASKRAVGQGRTVRLKVKVSFKVSGKAKKTVSKTTTVVAKPAKKQ